MLCVKDSRHLLEGQDEIHLTPHRFSHGFQFFRRAGPDKDHLCLLMLLLDKSRGKRHRRQRHGDAVRVVREQFFRHHGPCRTAGCRHKRQLFRNFLHEVLRLLHRAEIRADGDLKDVRKAQGFHGRPQLSRCYLRAKLTDKCRCHSGVHPLTCLDRADDLEDLGFVRNGSERAIHEALSA